jgi:hypothetical protein
MVLPPHKTKIVCTIGPASESPEIMERMVRVAPLPCLLPLRGASALAARRGGEGKNLGMFAGG